MEEQLAAQTADSSKIPTSAQLQTRNELYAQARVVYQDTCNNANQIRKQEMVQVSKEADIEILAWQASMADRMSLDETKDYLEYKDKADRSYARREYTDKLTARARKYYADLNTFKSEKKLAQDALNGNGPNSTQV